MTHVAAADGRVLQVNISPGGVPKLPVERGWVGPLGLDGVRPVPRCRDDRLARCRRRRAAVPGLPGRRVRRRPRRRPRGRSARVGPGSRHPVDRTRRGTALGGAVRRRLRDGRRPGRCLAPVRTGSRQRPRLLPADRTSGQSRGRRGGDVHPPPGRVAGRCRGPPGGSWPGHPAGDDRAPSTDRGDARGAAGHGNGGFRHGLGGESRGDGLPRIWSRTHYRFDPD